MMRRGALLSLGFFLALGCGGPRSTSSLDNPDPLETITGAELFRRGTMLAQAGDYTRAEQYLTAAIDRGHPEEETIPVLLGVCVRASRLVAALEYAQPYLARHPQQWPLRLLTATIHMGLHQHERARMELERVLRDAPEEPAQAHYFLAVLHRDSLGDYEGAREHFQRYLEIEPDGRHREEARAEVRPTAHRLPVRMPSETSTEEGAAADTDATGVDGTEVEGALASPTSESSSGAEAAP